MYKLRDYRGIISDKVLYDIYQKARKLYGLRLLNINSTAQGGGVAEILNSLVPLLNEVGIHAGWRVLHGNPDFFTITKKMHNGAQGQFVRFSKNEQRMYTKTNEAFSTYTHVNHDVIIIHDPQPLPLIQYYKKMQPWIWRCHIDISKPTNTVEMLKKYIIKYDQMIVSSKDYVIPDFPIDYNIIPPAIDPFTLKNKALPLQAAVRYIEKYGIPTDKPFIAQISRFDKWKDPIGVLKVFELVKKHVDCRLVLCGSMAADDPEGITIYDQIKEIAKDWIARGDVILTTVESNMLVNSLQTAAAAVIQKSLKEGFGLTVTESLWKGRPVIASNVGGIPLQIEDGKSGFLADPTDIHEFASKVIAVLQNKKLAEKLGKAGQERVREKFLMTRLLSDYLDLLIAVM